MQNEIAVIDVNIPEMITITADRSIDENGIHYGQDVAYSSHATDVARKEGEKLAKYIWDNYVDICDFQGGIWLIGAGDAFHAVSKLISDNDNVYQKCRGVIAFICQNPLRPVSSVSNNNPFISSWYRERSKIFVSAEHDVWRKQEEGKKFSKRYGKLIKSPEVSFFQVSNCCTVLMILPQNILNSMMQKHLPEVFDFIYETGDFNPRDEDNEDADDQNATSAEDENEPPARGPALSSPPQTRPLTGAATAQTSAALRGAISPRGAGALSLRADNLQQPSTSPGAFQSLSPGRSAPPSRSPALGAMQSPPGRDSAQPATEAMRHFGLGGPPQQPKGI